MQFSELTAVGTIQGKPVLDHADGKAICQFTLRVEAPGKQGLRASEIACRIIGGNAAACWSSPRFRKYFLESPLTLNW